MANKYTVQESNNLAIGQTHSMHLNVGAVAMTPPSNTVFIAIHILNDTRFTALVAEDPNTCIGTTGTDNSHAGGTGDVVADASVFPAGTIIYGRWTSITLTSGLINAYCGG
tara:strand:- start:2630 stop:2962 length:333 start_codon:yes stop_codon:yes gene_type:complete